MFSMKLYFYMLFNIVTDVFKFDPKYLENEEKYKEIKNEILGEGSDDEEGSEDGSSDEDNGMYFILNHHVYWKITSIYLAAPGTQDIEDRTSTNLVNLRRIIYLTIMNALNYEEAVHKLLKVQLDEGQEVRQIHLIYKLHLLIVFLI